MVKKIGIVCYPTVGGSGVVATELGIQLAEKGYEVHFISTSLPFRLKRLYPNIYFHEVEAVNYPVFKHPPYDLALVNKIVEVVDREQIDIIHAHYAIPHAICSLFAKQMSNRDVKVVTTLHGTDITVLGIDESLNSMIRYAIQKSDAVTAVSNSLREQTIQAFNIEKDIHVIYNFIHKNDKNGLQQDTLREQLNISEEEKVIIHISNFRKVKRVTDVVKAFQMIQSEIPAKLLLVGDGPEYGNIYRLVQELQLNKRVIFMGRQDNIHDLLKISDLKLLLSDKESFGLVLLEAMISGVPCIGTNAGGIPEVIKHNQNGFVCEIGDIPDISDKALQLLTNSNLWKDFSIHARKYVVEHFHTDKIVQQYEDLYKRIISQKVEL